MHAVRAKKGAACNAAAKATSTIAAHGAGHWGLPLCLAPCEAIVEGPSPLRATEPSMSDLGKIGRLCHQLYGAALGGSRSSGLD